ncbi:16S rRNA (guanine(966)-N(2))-methyltransferase RsmD [Algiphilus sp. NNCM1]|nr:16S rRNA (guanine(966)-N(2))-methyltransferase RsmD [Algiphilus acroporae]MCI5061699.1 16S rRNA (guanine(966)-N(2))-methyltransferase RsmD [Algiphilus sp.]
MAQRRPRGELRIIGGTWRSRRIRFADTEVRPTPDRVRQTTFDWLAPRIRGARVLDLCAGSGAMGLEALSRGATEAVFVDAGRAQITAIQAALELLQAGARACVVQQDALQWLQGASGRKPFDIAFVDPPYAAGLWARLLPSLADCMATDHRLYIEWPRAEEPEFGVSLQWHRTSKAAAVSYGLASFADGTQPDVEGGTACPE